MHIGTNIGKGFKKEMRERIELELNQNPNIENIIILTGNGIQYGQTYCNEELDKIKQYT